MKSSERLRNAIGDAYRNPGDLQIVVHDILGERLQNITALNQPVPLIVQELLSWCEAEGRLVEFVFGAYERKKGNPKLRAVTAPLRAASPLTGTPEFGAADWRRLQPSDGELETIILPDVGFEDAAPWVDKLTRLFRVVCRVEPQPPNESIEGYGTGFLVAPNVVMTNYHVVEPFLNHGAERVRLRFDYAVDAGGVGTAKGNAVELAPNWKIMLSPVEELDFALVRLAKEVGKESIQGTSLGSAAPNPRAPVAGEPMIILQHPAARALQLSIGSVMAPDSENNRVAYSANTEAGSSGSPCLTSRLDVLALHHRGSTRQNRGVRLDAISTFLKDGNRRKKLTEEGLAGFLA